MVMPDTGCEVVPTSPTMRAETTTKKKREEQREQHLGQAHLERRHQPHREAERDGAADHARPARGRVSVRGTAAAAFAAQRVADRRDRAPHHRRGAHDRPDAAARDRAGADEAHVAAPDLPGVDGGEIGRKPEQRAGR